jgi:hypothetical protein
VLLGLGFQAARAHQPATARVLAQTALNGFIAMGIGMTLVLLALEKGDVGMVADPVVGVTHSGVAAAVVSAGARTGALVPGWGPL